MPADREEMGKDKVLLMQIFAPGVGLLTLVNDRVLSFDPDYSVQIFPPFRSTIDEEWPW